MAQEDEIKNKVDEMAKVIINQQDKVMKLIDIVQEMMGMIRINDTKIGHALAVGEANADELRSLDVQREWVSEFDHEKEVAKVNRKIAEIEAKQIPDEETGD